MNSLFTFKALLAAFYLQGGIAHYCPAHQAAPGQYHPYDINEYENPYGTVELGFQGDLNRKIHVEFAARHASSIETHRDHGINSFEVRVRFEPFK